MDKEKITNLYNKTGYPFQQFCLEYIRNFVCKDGGQETNCYAAVSEYPFTYPKSNGPNLGIHSTIDIIAVTSSCQQEYLMFLIIECKKADEEIKNWIFNADDKEKEFRKSNFVFSLYNDNDKHEHILLTKSLFFPELGYNNIHSYDHCNQVIELREDFKKINLNQNLKVYNGIYQCNHASYAFERVTPKNRNIEVLSPPCDFRSFKKTIYLPILITTANLYIAKYNTNEIKEGNVNPNQIEYIPKDWLTYDFPSPDFINRYKDIENNEIDIEKRTTFVVNYKSLEKFLNKLRFPILDV
ncbi:hypothetical protein KKC88_01735 [Patescibacteria group bacterium]|nr:hypothetical protein [Patescibacteria group bacterium]MBU1673842.1 hypothetical protein [Patescibacteria group bacterium]MBU1963219.1 hypothetical protein [Patescibacteria group bacterium]